MNNWIQRNIIFPKINQHYQLPPNSHRRQNNNQSPPLPSLQKKISFNCLAYPAPRYSRKNYSIHIRNLDPLIIDSCRHDCLQSPPIQSQESELNSAVKKRLAILELMDDDRNMFHSISPRNKSKKLKPGKEEFSVRAEKIVEIEHRPHTLIMEKQIARKKKASTIKLKTEPAQINFLSERLSEIHEQRNDCLSIRKAKTFDYNELARGEQIEREGKRRSYMKAGQAQTREADLKITSIRGWNHEEEARDHLMPLYSYAW